MCTPERPGRISPKSTRNTLGWLFHRLETGNLYPSNPYHTLFFCPAFVGLCSLVISHLKGAAPPKVTQLSCPDTNSSASHLL